MDFERLSMARFEEILRLIGLGHSNRAIAKIVKCRTEAVSAVRRGALDGERLKAAQKSSGRLPPPWTLKVDWESVEREIIQGFENIRIWEEYASEITSHPNFYKVDRRQHTQWRQRCDGII